MKEIQYRIKGRSGAGAWLIEFWTKGKKNNLTFTVVTTEESKIRYHIKDIIGTDKFSLEFIKEKR